MQELKETFETSLGEFLSDIQKNLENNHVEKLKEHIEKLTIEQKLECFLELKPHQKEIFDIMLKKKSDYTIFKDIHLATPDFSIDLLFKDQTVETQKMLIKYLYNLYVLSVLIDNQIKNVDSTSFKYIIDEIKEKQVEKQIPENANNPFNGIMGLMNNPEIQNMMNSFGQKMQSGQLNIGSLMQGLMSGNLESIPEISEMTSTLERQTKNGEIDIEKIHSELTKNSAFSGIMNTAQQFHGNKTTQNPTIDAESSKVNVENITNRTNNKKKNKKK